MSIHIPPDLVGHIPSIVGLLVAAGGWGLAKYTQYVCRRDQARRAHLPDPAE